MICCMLIFLLLKDLFNWFLNSFEDILTAVSSVTIAEAARDNKEVQDAMALEGAIPPLGGSASKGKQLSVQVKVQWLWKHWQVTTLLSREHF